jgi:hypothetical protein
MLSEKRVRLAISLRGRSDPAATRHGPLAPRRNVQRAHPALGGRCLGLRSTPALRQFVQHRFRIERVRAS